MVMDQAGPILRRIGKWFMIRIRRHACVSGSMHIKNVRMKTKKLVLLALAVAATGCSTIKGRSKNTGVYPGMRAWPKVSSKAIEGDPHYLDFTGGFGVLAFPFVLMDFAITFPVDTVFLPTDAIYSASHPRKKAQPHSDEPGKSQAYTGAKRDPP